MGGSSFSAISLPLKTMSRVDDSTKSCVFYKLIVPSIIHERKLRIPNKFVAKLGHELSAVAKLTITNGRIWLIGLAKDGNKLWFHSGWQEFVQHYSIRIGYFLVFRYEGHSVFNVSIFNLTSLEIDYQNNHLNRRHESNHGKQQHLFEEMEDDDSVDSHGSFPPCQMPRYLKREVADEGADRLTLGMSYKSSGQQIFFDQSKLKNSVTWSNEDNRNMLNGAINPQAAMQATREVNLQYNGIESKEEIRKIKKAMKKKRKFDFDEHNPSASARKRTVTAEERERVLSASKMFEPVNPFCRVVLRPSYLYRGCIMYFPAYFAEKHLTGVSGFIKLQNSDGRQWSVRCLYKGGKAKLSLGWYDFSLENNLGEGDVCVFELISMKEIVLKVSTFRVREDSRQVKHSSRENVAQTRLVRF